ncbi:M15 family metallopeptidase [Winogradskyella maritima]|uniref:M15 family metallopeptidase n=1 Tax=Winogradskyella maritima TaxID=1517766 RepID=A0ABV8AGL7_9FLAO|nr:M15 family metallopeptidase [Winogradskyella maritima]
MSTDVIKPEISKQALLGKIEFEKDSNFIKVDSKYTNKTTYLRNATYDAFLRMYNDALKDNIHLHILSGARNFNYQKGIWERKWQRYSDLEPKDRIAKIMEYSSMPGTSRHHWGTDIDLNNLKNAYFETGEGKRIYDWLTEHANDYGFYQVYTEKSNGRTGYNLERWHWSYMPLAKDYLQMYNDSITYNNISGFSGSEYAEDLQIIERYVNGIDGY